LEKSIDSEKELHEFQKRGIVEENLRGELKQCEHGYQAAPLN